MDLISIATIEEPRSKEYGVDYVQEQELTETPHQAMVTPFMQYANKTTTFVAQVPETTRKNRDHSPSDSSSPV